MTTTETQTAATTRTCPPSAVVDIIIPWREVTAADLVVLDGVLTTPERVHVYKDIWNRETGETFIRVDVSRRLDNGHLVTSEQRGDSLTAVRRYTEGPSEADELRAELDLFKPQPMSQRCRDGKHNGTGDMRCINCWCLCHRAELSPKREALVIAALDEAAADRDERARFARHEGRTDEERGHLGTASQYRAERDRREAGRG